MATAKPKKGAKSVPPQREVVEPEAKSVDQLSIVKRDGVSDARLYAESMMSPIVRSALLARSNGDNFFEHAGDGERSDLDSCIELVAERCEEVRNGKLDGVTDMLVAQMAALDAIFSVCTKRAGANMGRYPEAVDRYMGLALKAQTGCRVTAETLARIKRGGKQTVKVVHVHEGGQAVVADTVNTQNNNGAAGGSGGADGGKDEQPCGSGARVPEERAALPRPDETGDIVPIPGNEGQEAVSVAWGAEPRSA
jgi:hypothetical protein